MSPSCWSLKVMACSYIGIDEARQSTCSDCSAESVGILTPR